jgi:HECT-domain (ubiquitin-transferase)
MLSTALHGLYLIFFVSPVAHSRSTCFNRLDLPIYPSKSELRSKLKTAITLSAVGFDMD